MQVKESFLTNEHSDSGFAKMPEQGPLLPTLMPLAVVGASDMGVVKECGLGSDEGEQ